MSYRLRLWRLACTHEVDELRVTGILGVAELWGDSGGALCRAVVLEMIGDLPEADSKPPTNMLFVCKLNQVHRPRLPPRPPAEALTSAIAGPSATRCPCETCWPHAWSFPRSLPFGAWLPVSASGIGIRSADLWRDCCPFMLPLACHVPAWRRRWD